jgi:hypothetical protein
MARDPKYVDGGDLAEWIDEARNGEVTRYLGEHRPSCHSEAGDALIRSAEKCGEWFAFSPSFRQFGYVALVTNRTVFALGVGLRSVCYRVPQRLVATALATGAVEAREIGIQWVRFELFRDDWPETDLSFWTLNAYAAARELS